MASVTSASGRSRLLDAPDFSLVLGGPLFQLLRRAHLADDALMLLHQRLLAIVLCCWLPLLVLSALEGKLWGGVTVPFLWDVEAQVRFLVALPLLVAAELVVHLRMRFVVRQFLDRHLIPEEARSRFEAAVASALRLRNSVPAEGLLIAFVYVVGVLVVWRQYTALDAATWYATPAPSGGSRLSWAGTWFGYVSLPAFQFLLVRWYFRLFIWARFLWHVSRIELRLVPTHPDRVGGLGFLSGTVYAFTVLALAHGALLAGQLANRIFHVGARLPDFKAEIAVMVAFLLCAVFGPLLVFAPRLAAAKRAGLREYGTLAQRYAREFDAKWLRGGAPAEEALLGSGDVQSLADMGNSFDVVRGLRIVPVTKEAVVQLAVATLLPIAPLLLTMMPLEELLRKLLGVLF